jgi:hypothetical protein
MRRKQPTAVTDPTRNCSERPCKPSGPHFTPAPMQKSYTSVAFERFSGKTDPVSIRP